MNHIVTLTLDLLLRGLRLDIMCLPRLLRIICTMPSKPFGQAGQALSSHLLYSVLIASLP